MAKNSNADNDYWDEYKRRGKDFRGAPEDLEDLVVEADSVRLLRKKNKDSGGRFIDE
jgi:hypothetical protein